MTVTDVIKPFLLTTFFLFTIAPFNSGEAYYNILVSGIPLMLFSILLMSIQILQSGFSGNPNNTFLNGAMSISPLIINAAALSMFLYLVIKNRINIIGDCNKGNTIPDNLNESVNDCISSDYSSFNIALFILIICQLMVMLSIVFYSNFNVTGIIESKYFIILFLFAFIQAILMIPIYTILVYFKADG